VDYREFTAHPSLAGRVRYWRLTGKRGAPLATDATGAPGAPDATRAFEAVLPDGCVEVIVHLGDPFLRRDAEGRVERQPRALVAGPGTRPVELAPTGRVDVIGVHIDVGGAPDWLDARPDELVDRLPALADVGGVWARDLAEELAEAEDGAWTCVLDRRLAAGAGAGDVARAGDAAIERAVARLRARAGAVPVGELARGLGLSTRQLERRFRARTGLAPKTFARLTRFQHALARLNAGAPSLADVALRSGYFDQAHLVRDFQRFAGASPTRFLRAPHELARHFVAGE